MKQCCMKWKHLLFQLNKKCTAQSQVSNTMKHLRLFQLGSFHLDGLHKAFTQLLNKGFSKQLRYRTFWKPFYKYQCQQFQRCQANLPFKSIINQPKHQSYLFAAVVCSFSWEDNGISNDEMADHVDELHLLDGQDVHPSYYENEDNLLKNSSASPRPFQSASELAEKLPKEWENILDNHNVKIWRLPYKDTGYWQYKVLGRLEDVSSLDFYAVQKNHEYRKEWDNLVIDIKVIDRNEDKNEEVWQWISSFPYPFAPREYVYIKRVKMFPGNVISILSRATYHPSCPGSRRYVRVPVYVSNLIIKPHKNPDDVGLDYLLTYCDDPRTVLPSSLTSWVVTNGIPDYVEKLHAAALKIRKEKFSTTPNYTASNVIRVSPSTNENYFYKDSPTGDKLC